MLFKESDNFVREKSAAANVFLAALGRSGKETKREKELDRERETKKERKHLDVTRREPAAFPLVEVEGDHKLCL